MAVATSPCRLSATSTPIRNRLPPIETKAPHGAFVFWWYGRAMSEGPPDKLPQSADPEVLSESERVAERERVVAEYLAVGRELAESGEAFPFAGITAEAHAAQLAAAAEFPEYTIPVDVLLAKFRDQGMKVVLGGDLARPTIYLLPRESSDIEEESIFPRSLEITDDMDPRLKRLVLADKKMFALEHGS